MATAQTINGEMFTIRTLTNHCTLYKEDLMKIVNDPFVENEKDFVSRLDSWLRDIVSNEYNNDKSMLNALTNNDRLYHEIWVKLSKHKDFSLVKSLKQKASHYDYMRVAIKLYGSDCCPYISDEWKYTFHNTFDDEMSVAEILQAVVNNLPSLGAEYFQERIKDLDEREKALSSDALSRWQRSLLSEERRHLLDYQKLFFNFAKHAKQYPLLDNDLVLRTLEKEVERK